ncbi:GNAT family N-acetyltransferase [Actinoplanes sp. NPDC049316]|uniref:GNAT family N-acetyltransferase n=1 Tax=Actinoplanes sp. NPDC049316 TaxID=3154727 RepID=UPI003436F715
MDDEFWISELTDDDVPAVVALCRAALDLPEDAAEAAEIVSRLRDTAGTEGWSGGIRRITGFIALRPAEGPGRGRIIGVVLGSVSHRDASVGHIDLIAVHPQERRRGVGRALVARVEGALAGLGAGDVVIAGNAPYYAWPGIDVRCTPAVCAAMALGFEQDQPAWNMTANLTDPVAEPPVPEGVTVRRATAEDVPALVDFALTTFGAGWAGEITHSVGRERAGCHVAFDKTGGILGFAAYGSSRPSWFGPMGTAPAARGLGIGNLLLRRCLADQRTDGHDSVQIGWVGPLSFYSKAVAARVERVFLPYRKQL